MSNSLVYYLKYRPQSLDQLIGQDSVKETLIPSFLNNKLAHAYLFVGPRGTGKTSTARILAKMVNCEKVSKVGKVSNVSKVEKAFDVSGIPCNQCPTCISITDGSNMDLIEIDAASNRGIEDIRSLRDKIKLAPTQCKKKVYIIDEVHMLTAEAFNALLKTLEEPPQHALFILATTESSKIPQTIISRVQRLDFKLAKVSELKQALENIIKSEKININEEALSALINKSDGSFRDAVKLLDQVSSIGGQITASIIAQTFKASRFECVLDLLKILQNHNIAEGLLNISKQIEEGADVREITLILMDALRDLVLIINGVGEVLVKPSFTEDKYALLADLSKSFSIRDLIRSLNILQNALEKLKTASIPSLPLELAVVEICTPSLVIARNEGKLDFPEVTKQSSSVKQVVDNGQSKQIEEDKEEKKLEGQISNLQPQNPSSNFQPPTSNNDIVKLKEKWIFVLETIRSINFSLEALLRSVNLAGCNENVVILEVPYSFHQRILEAPKNRDLVEGILSDILDRSIRISVALGTRPSKKEDIVNIEIAEDDEILRAAAEIFNSDTIN